MRVSAAWADAEMQYPCALVHAESSSELSDTAEWSDGRRIAVQVAVMTEAADELGDDNAVVRTARERNRDARSEVINALAVLGLGNLLNAQSVENIAFDHAQMGDVTRSVDGNKLVSMLDLEIVAEPVEGT